MLHDFLYDRLEHLNIDDEDEGYLKIIHIIEVNFPEMEQYCCFDEFDIFVEIHDEDWSESEWSFNTSAELEEYFVKHYPEELI